MSATFTEFRAKIAAYMGRDASTFIVNGVDLILDAANTAKREAQRSIDFAYLRTQADVIVDLTTGGDLTTAVVSGGVQGVSVNRIVNGYINFNANLRPIEIVSQTALAQRIGRIYDRNIGWAQWSNFKDLTVPATPMLVRDNQKISLWPTNQTFFGTSNPITVTMDVVQYATDYFPTTLNQINVVNSGDINGPLELGQSTFNQVGTLDNQALYFCDANQFWIQFMDVPPVFGSTPNGTPCWVITPSLYDFHLCWVSNPNANPLTPNQWLPFGFTATGNVSSDRLDIDAAIAADFFLTDCDEWLTNSVLRKLHYFVRQDDRFIVTQKMLDDSYANMVAWNDSISDSGSVQSYDLS